MTRSKYGFSLISDFFHKSQVGPLQAVVRNILVSTFHWTGTSIKDIDGALSVARQALLVHVTSYSSEDRQLLMDSIAILTQAKEDDQWVQTSEKHELCYYLNRPLPQEARQYYLLSGSNDAALGGSAVIEAQRSIQDALSVPITSEFSEDEYLTYQLTSTGIKNRARDERVKAFYMKYKIGLFAESSSIGSFEKPSVRKSALSKASAKLVTHRNQQINEAVKDVVLAGEESSPVQTSANKKESTPTTKAQRVSSPEQKQVLARANELSNINIISTSSAKLNYLITQIHKHSKDEKIIVFSDFVDHT